MPSSACKNTRNFAWILKREEQPFARPLVRLQFNNVLAIHLDRAGNDFVVVFFFNDTATTEIYTLSLHDALPISVQNASAVVSEVGSAMSSTVRRGQATRPSHNSGFRVRNRSEEHTSELQSQSNVVCRLLLVKTPGISLGY